MDKPAKLLVSSAEWQIIRHILQAQLPGYPVWAFGSRVNGPCKTFSDLDLAIIADQPLPLSMLAAVAEAFSESDLPFKVDLLDWATTSAEFRQRVLAKRLVLQ